MEENAVGEGIDIAGKFSIAAKRGDVLEVSYTTGYTPK
jgi:hypothetical protein